MELEQKITIYIFFSGLLNIIKEYLAVIIFTMSTDIHVGKITMINTLFNKNNNNNNNNKNKILWD
jgi:hypothetical protein